MSEIIRPNFLTAVKTAAAFPARKRSMSCPAGTAMFRNLVMGHVTAPLSGKASYAAEDYARMHDAALARISEPSTSRHPVPAIAS